MIPKCPHDFYHNLSDVRTQFDHIALQLPAICSLPCHFLPTTFIDCMEKLTQLLLSMICSISIYANRNWLHAQTRLEIVDDSMETSEMNKYPICPSNFREWWKSFYCLLTQITITTHWTTSKSKCLQLNNVSPSTSNLFLLVQRKGKTKDETRFFRHFGQFEGVKSIFSIFFFFVLFSDSDFCNDLVFKPVSPNEMHFTAFIEGCVKPNGTLTIN